MDWRRRLSVGLLALGASLLLAACGPAQPFRGMGRFWRDFGRTYDSNGERIYFTAVNQEGRSIPFEMGSGRMMGGMMGGTMSCADCHGPDGRGGRVRMMMTLFTAPDIRWQTLTAADHSHGETEDDHDDEEMEHPPYTEETLERAITHGLDPAGEPLAWPMPRWRMSDEDLDDLIDYVKTLE
jgi:cytochrome c oxidase subunit II